MWKKLGIVSGLLVAISLIVIAVQPSTFRVARSAEIHAPPDVVYSILSDLHQGVRWSPFEQLDPDMKREFSGPEQGPGAKYAWDGNSSAGAGSMTVEELRPDELVVLKLDFTRPMVATNEVRYELAPAATGTEVRWVMEGANGFLGKVICMLMDMDQMVGADFEKGLQNLDQVAQEEVRKKSDQNSPEATQ